MAVIMRFLLFGLTFHAWVQLTVSSSSINATPRPMTSSMLSSDLYTVSSPAQTMPIARSSDTQNVGVRADSNEPIQISTTLSHASSTVSEPQLNLAYSQSFQSASSSSSGEISTTSQTSSLALSPEPAGLSLHHTTTLRTPLNNDFTVENDNFLPGTVSLLYPSSHGTTEAIFSTTAVISSHSLGTTLSSDINAIPPASSVMSVSPSQTINPTGSQRPRERFSTSHTEPPSEQSSDENESISSSRVVSSNEHHVALSESPSHYLDTRQPSTNAPFLSDESMLSTEQSTLSTFSAKSSVYPTRETHQTSETIVSQTILNENVRSEEVSSFSQPYPNLSYASKFSVPSFTQPDTRTLSFSLTANSDISHTRYSSYINHNSDSISSSVDENALAASFSGSEVQTVTSFFATISYTDVASSSDINILKSTAGVESTSSESVFSSSSNLGSTYSLMNESISVASHVISSKHSRSSSQLEINVSQLSLLSIMTPTESTSLAASNSANSYDTGIVQLPSSAYNYGLSSEIYSSSFALSDEYASYLQYSTPFSQSVFETTFRGVGGTGVPIQSESSLSQQTLPLSSEDESWNTSASPSRLPIESTHVSRTLFYSSALQTQEPTKVTAYQSETTVFSLPLSFSSHFEVFPTRVEITSDPMMMSTSIPSTEIPDASYLTNITIIYYLKGDCDHILNNDDLSRKLWRALLHLTEMASDMSTLQQNLTLLDLKCDPFRAVLSIFVSNKTSIVKKIDKYFNSNDSHSQVSLRLNNGTSMVFTITYYELVTNIPSGHRPEDETALSEIVVISTASVICGILITFGAVICIREYLDKRKSERFRFPFSSFVKREQVALRSFPNAGERGTDLEMQDRGSLNTSRCGLADGDYSTLDSQKGKTTDFNTQQDMNSSNRSKKRNRSRSKRTRQGQTSNVSNGTASSQPTRGYGLVVGLMGYKNIPKDPTHIYAVPKKKEKVKGLSIRSREETINEIPTLPRDDSRRTVQAPDSSPTPPPRHLRSLSRNDHTTDSAEKLVPSKAKEEGVPTDGVINPAYKEDQETKNDINGSTASVHI